MLDGTKLWPDEPLGVLPFLEDVAAATIAAGDGPNNGDAIKEASPILGGKLEYKMNCFLSV